MAKRRLVYVPIDELPSADRNPKAHDEESTKASMRRFGFLETPIVDERTGKLIAGHGRRDALIALRDSGAEPPEGVVDDKRRGWMAPVIRGYRSTTDKEAEAAGVALNRIGEGLWDLPLLTAVLDDVRTSELGLEGLGYTPADLDVMHAQLEASAPSSEPKDTGELLRPPEKPFTKRGDVWLLGPHRIMCGDSREPADVDRLLAGARVNVAVTSPPYAQQRDYDEDSGFVPIPPEEYVAWFAAIAGNVARTLEDDGSWFVNIKPPGQDLDTDLYVFDLVVAHVREWGWHYATEFVWERNGVPKKVTRRFKNQFEPIYQFARGEWKIRPDNVRHLSANTITALGPGGSIGRDASLAGNQGGTGDGLIPKRDPNAGTMSRAQGIPGGPNVGKRPRGGRITRGIGEDEQGGGGAYGPGEYYELGLAYPGNRLPTLSGSHEAVGHAAAFPVGLPAWFIRAYSDEGDRIFDPFLGSGSTVLAADQESRVGFGMELSARYVDLACARYQRTTGTRPVKESTGRARDFSR